jgi:hypothetical protein
MKEYKNMIKIIAKLLIDHLNTGKSILENVLIAQNIVVDILKKFQIEMEFRTRGIDNALAREIADELEHEA